MKVLKYRKQPVVIEAVEFNEETAIEIQQWVNGHGHPINIDTDHKGNKVLIIPTPEGPMYAQVGDFIIRGVEGEFYPCKPTVFMVSYEALVD